jgi:flagella basal body P-ring formation protein FlgA
MKHEKTTWMIDGSLRAKISISCFLLGLLVFQSTSLFRSSVVYGSVPSVRAVVRVKAETVVQRDSLTLGDIAEVQTEDTQLGSQLRAIALGYAPQVGAVREFTREKIALAISAAGFLIAGVKVEAPPSMFVRRESQTITPGFIRQAVERSLATTPRSTSVTIVLTRLELPRNIEVPTGSVEVRASIAPATTLISPFVVSIEFWVERRLLKRLNATAQAEAFAPVLVAARDLAAKTRVRDGDYKIEVKPLGRSLSLYLSEPNQLRGASLVHSLALGEAITADVLVADIVVKPGDSVRIVGQSAGLSIVVMGEARAAGHVGDRIQVKNIQSGQSLQAVIVDEGVVSIRF